MILIEETQNKFNYNPLELGKTSTKICIVRCDYCNAIFERTVREIFRGNKKVKKDACKKRECSRAKSSDVYQLYTSKKINEINKKRENTCQKKFGYPNAAQSPIKKEKYKKTVKERYGVDHFSKTVKFRKKTMLSFAEIKNRANQKNYKVLFSEADYEGQRSFYSFFCNEHNAEFKTSVFNLSFSHLQCPQCNTSSSGYEREIIDFVSSRYRKKTETKNRKIIAPYELDLFFPNENVAIEHHGLFWHSEKFKEKKLHYNKFQMCKEKDIKLLQIFEDEWRDKRDIWESIICINIKNEGSLFYKNARNLTVNKNPDKEKVKSFLNYNHLQGFVPYFKAISLDDDSGNIQICITLRKPFTKNNNQIEIARLCSNQYTVVRGGFSRLMKYVKIWSKEQGYSSILTYSDCRYSWGDTYRNYGFTFKGHTGLGYDYTNFKDRFNRFKFRAQSGKKEKEIAEENGVCKIYNAGNYRWELTLD